MTKTIAYKGFNADWTCRDFQFEVGKTYEHEGKVKICGAGFHACTHPLDTFLYYWPNSSKYALVEMSGDTDKEEGRDTKLAAARIEIKAELNPGELIEAAVKHVFDAAKWVKGNTVKKYQGAASATGNRSAASATGYQGGASATGDQGAAMASGSGGRAKGEAGCMIAISEFDDEGERVDAWAGVVGKDGIKPDTWYSLIDGKPVEVTS